MTALKTNRKPNPPLSRTLLLGAVLIAVIALTMIMLLNVQQNEYTAEPTATFTQTIVPDGE